MPTEFKALLRDDGSGGVGGLLTGEHELCALSNTNNSSGEPTEVVVLVKNDGGNELSTEKPAGVSKPSDSSSDEKMPSNVPNGSSQPMVDKSSSPSKKMPALGLKGKLLSGGNNSKGKTKENASPQKGRNDGSCATLGNTKAALFAREGAGSEDGQFGTMSVSTIGVNNDVPLATSKRSRSDNENENGPVEKFSKKKYCSWEGCTNGAIKGGVCWRHGAKSTTNKKKCSSEGCTNYAVKGGVCVRHGAKTTTNKKKKKNNCSATTKRLRPDDENESEPVKKRSKKKECSCDDPKENEQVSKAIEAVEMNRDKKLVAGKVTLPRGVTVRPSGKWQAQIFYAGKSRYIGVFESREDACYAYEVAGQVLMTCNEPKDNEVDANINLAKRAAFAGVEKRCRGATPLSPASRARALIEAENDATHLYDEEVRKKEEEEEQQQKRLEATLGKTEQEGYRGRESAKRLQFDNENESGPFKQRSKKCECSADGCTNKVVQGGVCKRHGAKVKRYRYECSADGCTNKAQKGGVCRRHGAKVKLCNWIGCTKHAVKGGVCYRHGATRKQCNWDGCANIAVKGGVCVRHGATRKRCNWDGCTNYAVKGGECKRHGEKDLIQKA